MKYNIWMLFYLYDSSFLRATWDFNMRPMITIMIPFVVFEPLNVYYYFQHYKWLFIYIPTTFTKRPTFRQIQNFKTSHNHCTSSAAYYQTLKWGGGRWGGLTRTQIGSSPLTLAQSVISFWDSKDSGKETSDPPPPTTTSRAVASFTVRVGKSSTFHIFSSNLDQVFLLFLKLFLFSSSFWPSGWASRPPGKALATPLPTSLLPATPLYCFNT